ncbi:peptidoglycan-binding protein [Propylenella binzhouense]|uniref:Peptidoglycan binding-like domain-containing protein n=1 Tax=Propylenella binzhouense TaxID=2555902 RepID=A0A964WST3_9HYPH|nr:peptidoglycan-binding protein [Propylenella binzhouense]MYZ47302.1 hypothetical protein [Propylenella binzhouense]
MIALPPLRFAAARRPARMGLLVAACVALLGFMAGRAAADATIYYSADGNAYGWCAGGSPGRLDSCARKWCVEGGGKDCRAVVACRGGWGAIARPQEPAEGIGAVCGLSDAGSARIAALVLCMTETRTLCWTDTTFNRRGSSLDQRSNRAFDRVFQAQRMLQLLEIPGWDVFDGALGPKTKAAIRTFQVRLGMVEDGAVSDELLQALADALGGTDMLFRSLDLRTVLRPGQSYAHLSHAPPKQSFNAVTENLPENRRLTRLARMIRVRELPCGIPARAARLSDGKWTITCAEREYELRQLEDGSSKIAFTPEAGTERKDDPPALTGDAAAAFSSAYYGWVGPVVAEKLLRFASDWSDDDLADQLDILRELQGEDYLEKCRKMEKTLPVLTSGAAPAARLHDLYEAVEAEVRRLNATPDGPQDTVQLHADCMTLARYEKRPWAALFFSMVLAEGFPVLGVYPSVILSSEELGVTDFERVRLYAESANDETPPAEWAKAVLPFFLDPPQK